MIATSPEHAVELLDRAFAQGDLYAVLSLYEDAAVVITEPGKAARGTAELRSFIARALHPVLRQSNSGRKSSKPRAWRFFCLAGLGQGRGGKDFQRNHGISQAAGRLIDNPFGPLILGPD
jgi:hypothetical protein